MSRHAPCLALVLCALTASVAAVEFDKVIHQDEFDGETLEKPWGSWKSESVVRNGVMIGITPADADHPSVNQINFEPTADLQVSLSFRFAGSKRFSVMFRQPGIAESHAGHICDVQITPESVGLFDGKTGKFRMDLREKRKAGERPDAETLRMLETKQKKAKIDLDPRKWHKLRITIVGDVLTTWIDGKEVASLKSEGIGHPTKTNMNLTTVDREVHYDHFSLKTR